ncbi:formate/nitrite transporter family protein [Gottfriedia acidiceleris]|uniref:Formate/nitrite transporter family protein n=1 Tax=Gottfriedia acidiceleris TaxID=371036 RepID=A0ABY4JS32_9BACI|nr:formate/nitrite transporter family protein [Gottfriedia acidiceleris]UPM56287.1 formate/nitrite transporter family protein [Gottfriedia acidiceleris]
MNDEVDFFSKIGFLNLVNLVFQFDIIIFKHPETVTLAGMMISNLVPVTIGNIIGGSLFVGVAYWVSSSEAINKKYSNVKYNENKKAS